MHLSHLRKVLVTLCVLLIILPALLREAVADSESVTLVWFTATPGTGQISIAWETATELDVVGFCVQRSVQENGDYTRMPGCGAAKGNAITGATYSILDTAVEPGTRYYYRLEVINNNAAVELYGPVSAMTADPPRHVWHVATTGSDLTGTGSEAEPFATIQHGINMAESDDTVLVHPGVYAENINFNGKNIVVNSEFLTTGDEDAILRTVIDGGRKGHTVTFAMGETTAAQLNGFTITNGYAQGEAAPDSHGGGVFCSDNAAPSLTHLRVTGNEAADEGGGMYFAHCTPILRDISVTNNRAGQGGGGIRYSYGSVDMENVVISHNWAGTGGAGIFLYHADGYISNALIADNTGGGKGGGVILDGSSPKFTHVTVAGNLTTGHGGGLNVSYMSEPTLVNSIVWGNMPEQVYFDTDWPGEAISIEYSDIQGGQAGIVTNGQGPVYWGTGNLEVSPRFVHAGLGNYRLADDSPAISAGKAGGAPDADLDGNPRPGPAGSRPDMGAYENPLGRAPAAFTCDAVSEIPRGECEALVALYSDTSGKGWTHQDGWLETVTPCSWFGVTCEAGHVRSLALPHNALNGIIPPELSHLTELQSLDFGSCEIIIDEGRHQLVEHIPLNRLDGAIPRELGALHNLRSLNLNCARLQGPIPPELGDLANLQTLHLDGNMLTGAIPPELGELTGLHWLDISWNQLTGTPPSALGNLTNLQSLGFSDNPLSGPLPRSLMNLTLERLWFDNTQLCEPSDGAFQAWLAGITHLGRTGTICRPSIYLPLVSRPLPPVAQPPLWADSYQITQGQCTTLHWSVTNVRAVFLNDQGVPGQGAQEVCPEATRAYTLTVVYTDGTSIDHVVTIVVEREAPWMGVDAAGNFYRGNPNASVKLEEFMDFQCPFCARHALQTGPLIQQTYIDTGQVLQVFRNFPLYFHANALPAAKAAYCAGQQSPALFWAMYDWLFANQAAWSNVSTLEAGDRFRQAAVAAGADDTQYAACITDPTTDAHIQHDMQEGGVRGVRGTPTFYINSCAISGAVPYQVFQDIIQKAQQGECLGYPTLAPPIPTPIITLAPEPTKVPAPTATPVPVVDKPALTNRP